VANRTVSFDAHQVCISYAQNYYMHILCSNITHRVYYLSSHLSASSPTLQESTTAIVLKGSTASGLRGASKFLVKVDEYAALRKGGGGDGGKRGGGGGGDKGSGHGGDHRK